MAELRKELKLKVDTDIFTDQLNLKVCKQSLTNALSRKVNKSELDMILSNKADLTETGRIMQLLECKTGAEEFRKAIHHLEENKVNSKDIYMIKESIASKGLEIDNIVKNINSINTSLDVIIMNEESVRILDDKVNKLREKLTLSDELFQDVRKNFGNRFESIENSITTLDNNKASIEHTNRALLQKADAMLVEQYMESKVEKCILDQALAELEKQAKLLTLLGENLSQSTQQFTSLSGRISELQSVQDELQTSRREFENKIVSIDKSLEKKGNVKDICKLLDLKSNIK